MASEAEGLRKTIKKGLEDYVSKVDAELKRISNSLGNEGIYGPCMQVVERRTKDFIDLSRSPSAILELMEHSMGKVFEKEFLTGYQGYAICDNRRCPEALEKMGFHYNPFHGMQLPDSLRMDRNVFEAGWKLRKELALECYRDVVANGVLKQIRERGDGGYYGWDHFWEKVPGARGAWSQRGGGTAFLSFLIAGREQKERDEIIQQIDISKPDETFARLIQYRLAEGLVVAEIIGSFFAIKTAELGGESVAWNSDTSERFSPLKRLPKSKEEILRLLKMDFNRAEHIGTSMLTRSEKIPVESFINTNNYNKAFKDNAYDFIIALNPDPWASDKSNMFWQVFSRIAKPGAYICSDLGCPWELIESDVIENRGMYNKRLK